jgi:hypothetical protein
LQNSEYTKEDLSICLDIVQRFSALLMVTASLNYLWKAPVPWGVNPTIAYFLLLLLSISAVFCWAPLPRFDNLARSNAFVLKFFIVLFAIGILRLGYLHSISLWLDEFEQGMQSLKINLLQGAANDHQPPLDYLFTGFFLNIFGLTETALRMPTLIFSCLASVLFFFLARYLARSTPAAILLTLIFSLHPRVVQFGYEGRPIALGLFSCILLIAQIVLWFDSAATLNSLATCRQLLSILACASLSLLSLGLQPPILLASLTLVAIVFACFSKRPWAYMAVALTLTVAVALYLPIQIYIIKHCPPRLAMPQMGWSALLAPFKTANFFAIGFDLISEFQWLVYGLLGLGLFVLIRAKGERFLFLLGTTLVFPLSLVLFFKTYVVYPLWDYYVIFVLPLFWFSLAAGFYTGLEFLPKHLQRRGRHLAVMLFAFLLIFAQLPQHPVLFETMREDVRGVAEFLRIRVGPQDFIYRFCYAMSSSYCADGQSAEGFYPVTSSAETLVAGGNEQNALFYQKVLSSGRIPERAFFILQEGYEHLDFPLRNLRERFHFQLFTFQNLKVLEFDGLGPQFLPTTYNFFKALYDNDLKAHDSPYIMIPLMEAAARLGKTDEAARQFAEFNRISHADVQILNEEVAAHLRMLGCKL